MLTFHANCLLCVKGQRLSSGKNQKNVKLSSAQFAQRVIKVNDEQ